MNFRIEGFHDDSAGWALNVVVPDGETVFGRDVERLLVRALPHFDDQRDTRIPTVSECAAMAAERTLPDGWEVTLDAPNLTLTDGVASHSRRYAHPDRPEPVEAPCAADGSPIPATRAALLAA